jgi:CubicO group peptidase (beta-lactamase class C family)
MPFIIHRFCIALLFLASFLFPISAPAQEGRQQVTGEQVKAAVAALDKLTHKAMAETGIPGLAIAVVYQDQVVFARGYGVRQVGKSEPVDAETVFQLASVSKPIGSTVVAALIGEGTIAWDSNISDLDPGFAMYDPWVTRHITIRDLYAHRSGLPEHAGDLLEDLGLTRAEILYRLRYQHPDSSFRSHYAYTNFGMTAGGVAAAKAVGLTWEDAAAEKLYKPLSMRATSSRYADFVARTNKALGHVQVAGRWVQKYQRDPDTESPAGGASSSVDDLAKWLRLQLATGKFAGQQIVAEKPLAETHHPHMLTGFSPLTGLPGFYGLGWNVTYDQQGRLRLSHSGAFALGAATHVHLVPSEALGIVVLTNAYPVGAAEGLATTFVDLALHGRVTQDWLGMYQQVFANPAAVGVILGTDYSHPPASPVPALKSDAYIGIYTNDFFGDIAIIDTPAGFAIVEGPHKMTFPLRHYDRDVFTYETAGENAVGTTGVTFTIGADGKATTVVVENLHVHGEGTFKRVSAQATAP